VPIASLIFASIAALLHIFFWVLESLRWRQPATWRRFGAASQAEADLIAPMAFNQGFYNLFLAAGALVGVGLSIAARLHPVSGWTAYTAAPHGIAVGFGATLRHPEVAGTLIVFTMLCMGGAAAVLVLSNRAMARAALIQGAAPTLALLIAAAA